MFDGVVGDETAGFPVPGRAGKAVKSGLDVEQERPMFEGWQRNPSTEEWHYLRAGEARSVCGRWHRSRSVRVENRQPARGVCEMCLRAMGYGDE